MRPKRALTGAAMKRGGGLAAAALVVLGLLGACGSEPVAEDERPLVVATFTILQDFGERVAGEHLRVRTLVPIGAEVHEWELTPENFVHLETSSLVLYNGYNIEQWMQQARSAAGADVEFIAVAERTGIAPIPILLGDYADDPDPHLWMDPRIAAQYLAVIRDVFIDLDPENADAYERNAAEAMNRFKALYEEMRETLEIIPDERRVLVTSEAAFLYFSDAFDFEHQAIWGTNHEDEGTPDQIVRVVNLVREREVSTVFYESTISDRHVRSVAEDTGARVAGPLYVDSVSRPDGEAADYIAMQLRNTEKLVEYLGP